MPYIGQWGLQFENSDEERLFKQTRRLSGFHTSVVKSYYPEEAYQMILGANWNVPEPRGRGQMGNWGMALRYATLDDWYASEAIRKGKLTQEEVTAFATSWGQTAFAAIPLSDQDLLDYWRKNRKDTKSRQETNKRKRETRRQQRFQAAFDAERDPEHVYRRIKAAIPNPNPVDEQLLKQLARLISQANDALWQSENMKDQDSGEVALESLADYAKLVDLSVKMQKGALDLLKQHGYDFQARRRRREAQTAAEVLDETIEEMAAYFDEMALLIVCPQCNMELGSFIRNFPTVEYVFIVPKCPRCGHSVRETLESLADEVIDV